MSWRIAFAGAVLGSLLGWCLPARGPAAEPKKEKTPDSDLVLEVTALRTLYHFKTTPDQMKALKKVAGATAQKPHERKGDVSKDYRQALEDLRAALIEANDEDRIDELEEKLDQLEDSENPKVDDAIDVTDAARKQVPEVVRQLKPAQVASYIGDVADQIVDPEDQLVEALTEVRGLKGDKWKEKRDEVAETVSRLVAGLDPDKVERLNDEVVVLLDKVHGLKDEDFKTQQPELEKKARELTGAVGPLEVLRHETEYALAQLLSNPRLEAALAARLK